MQPFPHHYAATVQGAFGGDVELKSDRLPTLRSASPAEFDGPGDRWSPETLLVAAVGDCLILTFRAIARASGLAWTSLQCDVTGTLDRLERKTRFVAFDIRAYMQVPPGADRGRARELFEKAERSCLISNSLNAAIQITVTIEAGADSLPAAG